MARTKKRIVVAVGFALAFVMLSLSGDGWAQQKSNRIRMGMGKVWTVPLIFEELKWRNSH
jgi:hypothetical protein